MCKMKRYIECCAKVTSKIVPPVLPDLIQILPSCTLTISRTRASPSPTPPSSRLLDLSTRKKLEHTCPILLRDAAACVCNTQHSAAFLLPDRDMHRTAGGIVFDAVFNQIKEQAVDQGVAALMPDILTFLKEGDSSGAVPMGSGQPRSHRANGASSI